METLDSIETTAARWFKQFPHLDKPVTNWLSANVWWITMIGVVLGVLSILSVVPLLFGASVFVSIFSSHYILHSGVVILNAWIGVLAFITIIVLGARAIQPLKVMQHKGWQLLFISLLVSVASSLVGTILLMSLGALTGAVLTALVGGYFLFEIRDSFIHGKTSTKNSHS